MTVLHDCALFAADLDFEESSEYESYYEDEELDVVSGSGSLATVEDLLQWMVSDPAVRGWCGGLSGGCAGG